ncbi:MAG: hypothetical protein R3B99_17695 [Polyangiales bacterium]
MTRSSLYVAALALASVLVQAAPASAANYSIYVYGRGGWTTGTEYFGGMTGVNPRDYRWDSNDYLSRGAPGLKSYLDTYCTGSNNCYIACHSAGCALTGYVLDHYGCGWNIVWVNAAASAAGGSELANIGSWATGRNIDSDLRTGTMRGLYNHDDTCGETLYQFAGSKGSLWAGTLPGQDDEAVAYHSSGGWRSTASMCNPGDWFCDGTLPMGSSSSMFTRHTVYFRDDNENYNHSGIIGPMKSDMTAYAR